MSSTISSPSSANTVGWSCVLSNSAIARMQIAARFSFHGSDAGLTGDESAFNNARVQPSGAGVVLRLFLDRFFLLVAHAQLDSRMLRASGDSGNSRRIWFE